jgi:hypothetical protein
MVHLTEGKAVTLAAMVASLEHEVLRAMDDAIFGSFGELQAAMSGPEWLNVAACAS